MVNRRIKLLLRTVAIFGALAVVFLGTTVHLSTHAHPNDDSTIPDEIPNGNGDSNSPSKPPVSGNRQFDFVSLDPGLTGNLAALGFKPTAQSLYNDAVKIPEYISQLGIATQRGQQPVDYNTEVWQSRDSQAMYGFSTNKTAALNGGVQHYIEHDRKYEAQTIPNLSNIVDPYDHNYVKPWSLDKQITDLAMKLDGAVKNKDGSSIFGDDIQTCVSQLTQKFDAKVKAFKEGLASSNKTISFWGQSFGPVAASSSTSFTQFSPATEFPSWLFGSSNSVGLKPSVPTNNNFKLSTKNGTSKLGWYANDTYNPTGVQNAFANSSDYVVVTVSNRDCTPENILSIKNTFNRMLKPGSTTIRNIIILIADEFSLSSSNLLGMEYTMDLLSTWILPGSAANQVKSNRIFDLNNLKTLSRDNYYFV